MFGLEKLLLANGSRRKSVLEREILPFDWPKLLALTKNSKIHSDTL
jgi:hypothetical protein